MTEEGVAEIRITLRYGLDYAIIQLILYEEENYGHSREIKKVY